MVAGGRLRERYANKARHHVRSDYARAVHCPVLVSRADELARLRDVLGEPGSGRGGVLVLRGEPGVGKSRLTSTAVREAEDAGMTVLAGRAVRSASPVPLRPLAEALLAWLRTGVVPDDPRLAPYLPALGRLAPQLGSATDDGASSVMLIGEALLRLAGALGGAGTLLVVEDLHWADPETLSVLEYVADNARDLPLVVLATTRPHESATVGELIEDLAARRAAEVVDLQPLGDDDVRAMLAACLRGEPPPEVEELVRRYSSGYPLLVEEMLADLQSSGGIARVDGRWIVDGILDTVRVPRSYARSVATRLDAVSPTAREVVEAAALLGVEFDWQVVGAALGHDDRTAAEAIRELRTHRLVVPYDDGFALRHALVREAVLASLLVPDRRRLAGALATAIASGRRPSPESDQVLAELFEAAGDEERAALHWLGSARSSIARGALISAHEALARAQGLVAEGSDLDLDAREAEVEVRALAGEVPAALEVGSRLSEELARRGAGDRVAGLRLRLARALLAGGLWDDAEQMLDRAGDTDRALAEVLRARLALGRDRAEVAVERARSALQAVGDDRPEVACEAWEILGRAARGQDAVEADSAFEEGYRLADRHGLVLWRCRLLAALGAVDLVSRRPTDDRLVAARSASLAAGAIATAARADLDLNLLRIRYLDLDEAMAAIDDAIEVMERLRLPDLAAAYLIRACTHGLAGRFEAMESDIATAMARDISQPMELVGVPGHVRAPVALAHGRFEEARAHFADAMTGARRYPGMPFSTRGFWALLEAALDEDRTAGEAAREEVRVGPQASSPHNLFALHYADAIAHGRAGRREEAERVFADAEWSFPGREPWMELHARLLVARAAAADGWGDPERWFRHVLDGFVDYGLTEAASACRVAMREAGFAVPRKAAGSQRVPAHLQQLGVTSREYDVLELVVEGLQNRQIADRLFLSVRTVETHVTRLLQRTGVPDRGRLAAFLTT